jgi:transcriptional regulator with XRE-family HTH domain
MWRTYKCRVKRGEQNISIQNLIQIAFTLNVEVGELVPLFSKLQNERNNERMKKGGVPHQTSTHVRHRNFRLFCNHCKKAATA